MRIAVNIDGQFQPHLTGIQHYTDSLLGALYGSGTEHEITAFASWLAPAFLERGIRDGLFAWRALPHARLEAALRYTPLADGPLFAQNAGLRSLANKIDGRLLNPMKHRLSDRRAQARSRRFDVLHTPDPFRPQFMDFQARRSVVTIHDITTRLFPDAHGAQAAAAGERYFAYARDCCARVIVVSESTKRDVVEHLGIPADRVDVTHTGPRATTRRVEDPAALRRERAALGLADTPYVLYAGTLEPRKNLPRLIAAFARVVAQSRLPEHRLVLAGGSWGRYDEELRRVAQDSGIADRVVMTGYVTNDSMNALMTGSDAFAYVSEYEGFGMPPLEAMVCGAPVVASNTTSLPEVVGDAGIQVPPQDVEAIAGALHCLLTDRAENARRRALSTERAAQFSWARTAALTLRAYEAAAR
uniref:Glycosyl transferase, group 1 n=1 Tax=uncultured Armatimonadetes bacterium TaxID=157466 RepID=A0A6J4JTZ2_9BACT|nr:hypothetical protein AVDCRST_MAG63-4406 [uncultured Armatimonadetes bacterium]